MIAVTAVVVFKPLTFVGRFLLRLTLPIYRLFFNARRKTTTPNGAVRRSFLGIITSTYIIHVAIVVLTVSVAVGNLSARGAGLADAAGRSVFGKIIVGENPEGQEIIERTPTQKVSYVPRQNAVSQEISFEAEIGSVIEPEQAVAESGNALQIPVLNDNGVQQRSDVTTYVVQGGDTIGGIANRFAITQKTILAANNLANANLIKPGQELLIPPITGVLHKVAKGDSIGSISQKYKVDSQEILDFNRLTDPSSISVDQLLTIPGAEVPDVVPDVPAAQPQPPKRGIFAGPANVPSPAPPISGGKLNWPTARRGINQYFRYRHTGIDAECRMGDPLYAAREGTVSAVIYQRTSYGYHVIIDHGAGFQTLYGHASKIFVKPGQRVTKGQTIAMCGSTGYSTGTHVHFETRINGRPVNPLTYL